MCGWFEKAQPSIKEQPSCALVPCGAYSTTSSEPAEAHQSWLHREWQAARSAQVRGRAGARQVAHAVQRMQCDDVCVVATAVTGGACGSAMRRASVLGKGVRVPATRLVAAPCTRNVMMEVYAAMARPARCAAIARDMRTGGGYVIAAE